MITIKDLNAPEDVASALERLREFYNGSAIVNWQAGLWDTEVGAFYYSNSARDTEGYFPDIESTVQLLRRLEISGAFADYNNDFSAALPECIKEKLIAFARDMQSPEDGFFYHRQWRGMSLSTARVGRDLSWAIGLLKSLGAQPLWDAPDGTKGLYGSPSTNSGAQKSEKKQSLDFATEEEYLAWLEEFNATIKENSGRAHEMNAMRAEISGKGFVRATLDYLDRIQDEVYAEQTEAGEEPTGLWQKPVNYRAVWGLLKFMPFYNDQNHGRPIRYAADIVKTCVKVIAMPPDGKYYMNDLYNQWSGINSLLGNVKKYNPELLPSIYEITRANAASLIDNSLEKIKPFAKADGSFSYKGDGRSLSNIYGVPISLGAEEGDVNATALCCSMYKCIFTCLGYTDVPLMSPADGARFIETIVKAEPVVKKTPVSE